MNMALSWSAIGLIAEKRIEKALAEGEFDNLPGSGKPLQMEDMSHVPETLRMAYKILHNAGCLPPELQERKEISNLLDLLEHCGDERERVHGMQRLHFLLQRLQTRQRRHLRLEEADPYYEAVLNRLAKLGQKAMPIKNTDSD